MSFTRLAEAAIRAAQKEAKALHSLYVGTEHLLLGLMSDEQMTSQRILANHHIDYEKVLEVVNLTAVHAHKAPACPDRTPKLGWILEDAEEMARMSGTGDAGTEHLLLAITRIPDCAGARVLGSFLMNASQEPDFRDFIESILDAMGSEGDFLRGEILSAMNASGPEQEGTQSALEQFSTDLTRRAASGGLDPVIGRETQIERMMQILCRRTKNNPCLIGEPGVGKTAIVEGLACRIASGDVPPLMANKRILNLDLSGMVAGTKYRGEFEQRIKQVIAEATAGRDMILFIDEVHTLIGAGGSEGAMDAANILKPAMARGELQIIGATTTDEYKKRIERDAALERRFAPVMVEEPTEEESLAMLEGLKPTYERFHGIAISQEALEAAVHLSARYIPDRFLPDKAIDVLDEAAARLRLGNARYQEGTAASERRLSELDCEISGLLKERRFDEAKALRKEFDALDEKIEKRIRHGRKDKQAKLVLKEQDVTRVVSAQTRIPLSRLSQTEMLRLRTLEETLHRRVISQDEAVSAVAKAVRRGRVGIKEPGRPVGSFLFLGPTGVGKTEISKALAEAVFGSENAMIRVDMSEYMEKHSVSRLIGSPPGYVGYEEGGQLSDRVRRNPYSVLLFDEIEKAHPDVFNILLQILDDGHVTDAHGRKVDFKNCIIIMTSNAGASSIVTPKKLGFSDTGAPDTDYQHMKDSVMEEVRRLFKPEFLNRIDEIIVFRMLSREDMKKIASLNLRGLRNRMKTQLGIRLSTSPALVGWLVERGYDPKYGARPLRRLITGQLEDALSDAFLEGRFARGDAVRISVKEGVPVVEKTS